MRSVITHLVLLLVCVVFAWTVWSRGETPTGDAESEEESSEVFFDVRPDAITEVTFESDKRRVAIKAMGRGEDRGWDVSTYRKDERRRPPPRRDRDAGAPDGGPDGGPAATPDAEADAGPTVETVETRRRFTGNKALTEWLGKIAPLRAKRAFGRLAAATLEEFELKEPRGTVTIRAGSKTLTLKVGGAPFGSSDAYVLDATSRRAYLVDASAVRDLEFAESRFMQRELVAHEAKEIAKAIVKVGDKRRTLIQRGRDAERGGTWTFEGSEERNETVENWVRRLLSLRAVEYLEPGAEPSADGTSASPTTVLSFEVHGPDKKLGEVEIVRLDGEPDKYFARSTATRGWVELSGTLAEQIESDLPSILP